MSASQGGWFKAERDKRGGRMDDKSQAIKPLTDEERTAQQKRVRVGGITPREYIRSLGPPHHTDSKKGDATKDKK